MSKQPTKEMTAEFYFTQWNRGNIRIRQDGLAYYRGSRCRVIDSDFKQSLIQWGYLPAPIIRNCLKCGEAFESINSYRICSECKNGAFENSYHASGYSDRLGAVCARSCLDYLEKNNRISNRFVNPFRKRDVWQVLENQYVSKKGA